MGHQACARCQRSIIERGAGIRPSDPAPLGRSHQRKDPSDEDAIGASRKALSHAVCAGGGRLDGCGRHPRGRLDQRHLIHPAHHRDGAAQDTPYARAHSRARRLHRQRPRHLAGGSRGLLRHLQRPAHRQVRRRGPHAVRGVHRDRPPDRRVPLQPRVPSDRRDRGGRVHRGSRRDRRNPRRDENPASRLQRHRDGRCSTRSPTSPAHASTGPSAARSPMPTASARRSSPRPPMPDAGASERHRHPPRDPRRGRAGRGHRSPRVRHRGRGLWRRRPTPTREGRRRSRHLRQRRRDARGREPGRCRGDGPSRDAGERSGDDPPAGSRSRVARPRPRPRAHDGARGGLPRRAEDGAVHRQPLDRGTRALRVARLRVRAHRDRSAPGIDLVYMEKRQA